MQNHGGTPRAASAWIRQTVDANAVQKGTSKKLATRKAHGRRDATYWGRLCSPGPPHSRRA